MARAASSLHRQKGHVSESCTVSREGAVNLSCDTTLPARDLRVCTFLYACLSTRTLIYRPMQAHTLHQRETHFSTLGSDPSSGVRTELLESLVRARFIEAEELMGTDVGAQLSWYGSGPSSLRLPSWPAASIFSQRNCTSCPSHVEATTVSLTPAF